jgi:lipopolysaccharide transport system permease protein
MRAAEPHSAGWMATLTQNLRLAGQVPDATLAMRLAEPYLLFWRHRSLLVQSTAQKLRARHAGSIIGLGWLLLGPLILLGLYALLYTVIFRIQPAGLTIEDYVFYIFAGLVPFIAFGQALNGGAGSLVADRALLLNRVFRAELIPAREVLAAGAFLIVGGGVILLVKTASGGASWAWLLLPLIVILLAMATMGVVWGLAMASLVFKDIQQIVGYIVTILLIASPIAYTPEMVPTPLRILIYANPFAYYVQAFQSVLVLGRVPPIAVLAGCIVFALLSFHGIYRAFNVCKRIIADHI